ncbi:MAG: primosomal protein N', partial [Lachnospiraceae bacterium]|nr:primosomal protein N' [Lachnospiraceae bacterium]
LCAVLGSGENEEMLHTAMEHLVRFLGMIDPANRLSLIGPAYPPVRKVRDQYREMLYLRSERKENLIAANEKISRYVAANRGFSEISIQFDYNI